MRCVTVDVNQSERDALVVRGYLSEEERDNGAAIKKAIEGVLSDIELDLQSKPLSAVELAPDRRSGNASQVGEQFHVTRHRRDSGCTQRGTRVIEGSAAAAPEPLQTSISEALLGRNLDRGI